MLAGLALCVSQLWLDAWGSRLNRRAVILLIALLSTIPAGDLLAGVFANAGWTCTRNLFDGAGTYRVNRPRNAISLRKILGKSLGTVPQELPPTRALSDNLGRGP